MFSACFVLKLAPHKGEGVKREGVGISKQSTQNLWPKKFIDPCTLNTPSHNVLSQSLVVADIGCTALGLGTILWARQLFDLAAIPHQPISEAVTFSLRSFLFPNAPLSPRGFFCLWIEWHRRSRSRPLPSPGIHSPNHMDNMSLGWVLIQISQIANSSPRVLSVVYLVDNIMFT